MGLIHSPSIVSDGLVLALDAQNSRSYGGSGTTWTDVSYNGNNGTLTNGPTFEPGGPFAGSTGGSVYFDGTGDYLTVANDADFQFGSSDYTIESWVYLNNLSTIQGLFGRYNTSSAREIYITLNTDGSITHRTSSNGTSFSTHTSSTGLLTAQTWHHVAVSKSGTNSYIAVDGVVGSGTVDSTLHTASQITYIGDAVAGSNLLNGNLSNYRIIKGTALYTSNFTPPTKPLTPVSGTSLLTCQGGAIVDNSSNKFSITKNGDARAIQSASIKFDGANDFGEAARSNDFDFGTGDLTIESWVYITEYDAQATALVYKTQSSGTAGVACGYTLGSNGLLYMLASDNTSYQVNVTGGIVTLGRWHHICMTRVGSTWTCYLNTTQVSTATWAGSVSHVTTGTFGGIGMGAYTSAYGGDAGRYSMNGNISNVRIYKGKGLTAEEVSQNFNALRGRFGV